MADAKFKYNKLDSVKPYYGDPVFKLGKFGMTQRANGRTRFVSRDEVKRVLTDQAASIFFGSEYISKKSRIRSQGWTFSRKSSGGVNFGCQSFNAAAVKKLARWSGAEINAA